MENLYRLTLFIRASKSRSPKNRKLNTKRLSDCLRSAAGKRCDILWLQFVAFKSQLLLFGSERHRVPFQQFSLRIISLRLRLCAVKRRWWCLQQVKCRWVLFQSIGLKTFQTITLREAPASCNRNWLFYLYKRTPWTMKKRSAWKTRWRLKWELKLHCLMGAMRDSIKVRSPHQENEIYWTSNYAVC